jgi:hypothetical protein
VGGSFQVVNMLSSVRLLGCRKIENLSYALVRDFMKKGPSSKRQAERATLRVDNEMLNSIRAADPIFMDD